MSGAGARPQLFHYIGNLVAKTLALRGLAQILQGHFGFPCPFRLPDQIGLQLIVLRDQIAKPLLEWLILRGRRESTLKLSGLAQRTARLPQCH